MDAGLLLKYSRGQNIFPSSDIDFGIEYKDYKNILLFAKYMKKKGYLVTTLGNTSVIFEGITLAKKDYKETNITVDIYIYYPIKNYLCRPNCHKPLKQSKLSILFFIIFNKLNILFNLNYYKKFSLVKKICRIVLVLYSKFYFQFSITSQFAIPKKIFKNFKNIKIYNEEILIPKNNIEYMQWRYGNKWKTPNKNWRLTDGNMVFLNNLKSYWKYFYVAPYFDKSFFKNTISNSNIRSIFKFDEIELKKIKASKIKSNLFNNLE